MCSRRLEEREISQPEDTEALKISDTTNSKYGGGTKGAEK